MAPRLLSTLGMHARTITMLLLLATGCAAEAVTPGAEAPELGGKADEVGFDWDAELAEGDVPPLDARIARELTVHLQTSGDDIAYMSARYANGKATDRWLDSGVMSCALIARRPVTVDENTPAFGLFVVRMATIEQEGSAPDLAAQIAIEDADDLFELSCFESRGASPITWRDVRDALAGDEGDVVSLVPHDTL